MPLRALTTALVIPMAAAILAQPVARVEPQEPAFDRARSNAVRVEELLGRAKRVLHGWLRHADPQTLLLPDYLPSFPNPGGPRPLLFTPHNSGADNSRIARSMTDACAPCCATRFDTRTTPMDCPARTI